MPFKTMIIAIIQARMGSSRLPGKVLADIGGRSMIQRIIERVEACPEIDKVVVATTTASSDDALESWAHANTRCAIYRGSENDVLDRFYQCARQFAASIIVRVTADDPLKDPDIISRALKWLETDPTLDYCSNTLHPTYPEGLDVEVFRFEALERAHKDAMLPSDREHVTPYMWKNPSLFHLKNIELGRDLSSWRWTVDKPEDLEFVRAVFANFPENPLVSYLDVIALLDAHPELNAINQGTVRNEGYLKSIQMEKA